MWFQGNAQFACYIWGPPWPDCHVRWSAQGGRGVHGDKDVLDARVDGPERRRGLRHESDVLHFKGGLQDGYSRSIGSSRGLRRLDSTPRTGFHLTYREAGSPATAVVALANFSDSSN